MKVNLKNILVIFIALLASELKLHATFTARNRCNQVPPDPKTIKKDLAEPYASLAHLPLNMGTGVFSEANKANLEHFIKKYTPKTIVEVGAFLGASAIFMASIMPKDGRLYAIDNWSWHGIQYYSEANSENAGTKAAKTYEQFLSNVKCFDLTEMIIPIYMDSIEASKKLGLIADLIYIDADHSEEAVYNDIIHWYPKLSKSGIICGDDWEYFDSVRRGVIRAAKELGKEIKFDHNFWYFVF